MRGFTRKTHVKIPRSQILQHKIRENKLNKSKDEMKVLFYGSGCGLDPIFEVEDKIMATNIKIPLKGYHIVG